MTSWKTTIFEISVEHFLGKSGDKQVWVYQGLTILDLKRKYYTASVLNQKKKEKEIEEKSNLEMWAKIDVLVCKEICSKRDLKNNWQWRKDN